MKLRARAFLCLALWTAISAAEVPIACQESMRPKKFQVSQDFSGELPIADYGEALRACLAPMGIGPSAAPPAPASPWLESERELYRKVVARTRAEVLVVPFQVQGYGLDRIERSLMTAELAYAIGAAGQHAVADPFLVARALGEGERRIDPGTAQSLAERVGARHMVLGFVGHDKHHAFTLTLQVHELATSAGVPSKKVWQKDWRGVSFTDEQTPALVLHRMLPELLRDLPLGFTMSRAASPVAAVGPVRGSPRQVATARERRGASPAMLDLFGALTASTDERSRERLFARAVLASWSAAGDTAGLRFDEAYALMNLERRPSALARLSGLATPEAATLRALLQGDLPTTQSSIGAVREPRERLLLQIALRDLQFKYQREPRTEVSAATELFGKDYASWKALVTMRAVDADPWSNGEALSIKQALDAAFPIAGLDADSVVRGGEVVRAQSTSDEDIDSANVRHVRLAAERIPPAKCCSAAALAPTEWDLLWLLEGLAESRVVKAVYQMIDLQGQPLDALAALDHAEPFFGGNPLLAAARAGAAASIANRSAPEVAKTLSLQGRASGVLAAYWAHGQSRLAARALIAAGASGSEASTLRDTYAYDYPRRGYWIDGFLGDHAHPEQRSAFAIESLAFSRDDVTPLTQLRPGNAPGEYDAATANFGSRFAGNPLLPTSFQSADERKAYEADPIPGLQAAIRKAPDVWLNYEGLGGSLILLRGDYEGSAKAYLSYPGFAAQKPADPVAVANAAFDAGRSLYVAGRWELAQPLLEIAANLDTGSAASQTSAQWLLSLRGDYLRAAAAALARAKNYRDVTAYRDYLALLHVLGAGQDAWKGFSQLLASFESPQLWVSALAGHGREGADEAAVRAWLLRPEILTARFHGRSFAPYYAVLWNATDRVPPADLGKLVEGLDAASVGHIDSDGSTLLVPGASDTSARLEIRPSPFRAGKVSRLPPGTPIKSKLAYFADAYSALRHGDATGAVTKFMALADHYPIEESQFGGHWTEAYPLAYFARAAAKAGDAVQLEAYVDGLKTPYNFDMWLAKAFFASARRDPESAVRSLETAFRHMQTGGDQPVLVEYQYAEACEWLYQDTHDPRFLARLLDWAVRSQRIRPTYAWAYALQYAYAKDPQERRRALAIALYLDPAAAHIRSASKKELADARSWLRDHNPFQPIAPQTTT